MKVMNDRSEQNQAAVAEVELRLARRRQRLVEEARGYRGGPFVVVALVLIGFATLVLGGSERQLLAFGFFALVVLIAFHVMGLNRRLDALCQLRESELEARREAEVPDGLGRTD